MSNSSTRRRAIVITAVGPALSTSSRSSSPEHGVGPAARAVRGFVTRINYARAATVLAAPSVDENEMTTTSGVPHARIARQILLERVDDARRRQSKKVLRRYARLELRDDADAGRRHLLGRQNNRPAGWRNVRYQRAGFCRRARRLDALHSGG